MQQQKRKYSLSKYPSHTSFASSLRKYSAVFSSSKNKNREKRTRGTSPDSHKKYIDRASMRQIRPFLATESEELRNGMQNKFSSVQSQVQCNTEMNAKINIIQEQKLKKQGNKMSLVKDSQLEELSENMGKLSSIIDKFKALGMRDIKKQTEVMPTKINEKQGQMNILTKENNQAHFFMRKNEQNRSQELLQDDEKKDQSKKTTSREIGQRKVNERDVIPLKSLGLNYKMISNPLKN